MLEEKIAQLIQSIDILNVNLERLWEQKQAIHGEEEPEAIIPLREPTKKEPKETTITHDELHNLCLAIVRKTPTAKKKIQKILSNRLVKELPEEELETIKAKLEKI